MLNHFVLQSKAPRHIPDKHHELKKTRLVVPIDDWTDLWTESRAFKRASVVGRAITGSHLNRATFARIMRGTQWTVPTATNSHKRLGQTSAPFVAVEIHRKTRAERVEWLSYQFIVDLREHFETTLENNHSATAKNHQALEQVIEKPDVWWDGIPPADKLADFHLVDFVREVEARKVWLLDNAEMKAVAAVLRQGSLANNTADAKKLRVLSMRMHDVTYAVLQVRLLISYSCFIRPS
jgi:hypothetical protein